MKPDLDAALERIRSRIEAGETLEQCLADFEPATAAELRPLLVVTQALAALRFSVTPAPEATAAQRQKFLAQAAAFRREQAQAPAPLSLWQQLRAWLAAPKWRDALTAATLTLVLGLALLGGVMRGAFRMQQAQIAPSATFVALVGDTATPAPSTLPTPALTPTAPPRESPTPAPRPSATPLPTETPAPVTMSSEPTMSPSPTPIVPTPTPPAITPTLQPTSTRPPIVVTVAPTATPAPPTPTPAPPLPTATERPERPTAQPTVAPPTATLTREPTQEPTATATRTKMPGPRMETTPLPTPPR